MKDRSPYLLGVIVVLTLLAIYLNLDLFRKGFQHSPSALRLLSWQGEDIAQRSLTLKQGLDLQGGLQVLLRGDVRTGQTASDLQQAARIIRDRVDSLGVTEPLIQTQGNDKIVVELPGVKDPDLAIRTIGETALLEFIYSGATRLSEGDVVSTTWRMSQTLFANLPTAQQQPFLAVVQAAPEAGAAATGAVTTTGSVTTTGAITATAGAGSAGDAEPMTIYPTVLTGAYLTNAQVGMDPTTTKIIVNFQLSSEGGEMLRDFTRDHHDDEAAGTYEIMPITLDGKVISAPSVKTEIGGGQGMITGNYTRPEAEAFVAQLNSGALPIKLSVVGQTLIGPTLGRESVDMAVKGGLVGLLAVTLFMLIYYRMPGLLADIALLLYALLNLALFRLVPVTLTLAGIAGFVLSIGMAVDANVLIFERMKEELRGGRRLAAAVDVGFSRAFTSIRDSNISTLITCAILFWFGNQFGASIVKGFAVTLALGVVTSMFTAIVVTRSLLKIANRYLVPDAAGSAPLDSPRLRKLFGF